jgi:hypothetical protein
MHGHRLHATSLFIRCSSDKQELGAFVRLKAEQLERLRPVGGGPSSPPAFQLMLDENALDCHVDALSTISPHVEVRAALIQACLQLQFADPPELPRTVL